MLSVQTNMLAQNAERQLKANTKKNAKNTERLSSGYKINRAADDAAGLAISEKMRWMIRGLQQGTENTTDGISFVQIGDGAMSEIDDMIHRMTELSIQAANGTLTDIDRELIDLEVQQLKKQINSIGKTTTFNEIPVFDNSYAIINVDGALSDLEIFDATYDDASGEVTFGGFIFHGERISWDTVDPNMVKVENGKQVFNAGTYKYETPSGTSFTVTCQNGAAVPGVTRQVEIEANDNGLLIDGELVAWNQMMDENGRRLGPNNVHEGAWEFEYQGASVSIYIPSGVGSIPALVNKMNELGSASTHYVWETKHVGNKNELAVDAAVSTQTVRISQALANALASSKDFSLTILADKDGISVQEIAGSKKSWSDLGITSWDSGTSISGSNTYTYSVSDGSGNDYFSFDFKLSDVTSVDSVIDGLDGMVVSQKNIQTNYEITAAVDDTKDENILSYKINTQTAQITFENERDLRRDFDIPSYEVAKADGTAGDLTLSGSDVKINLEPANTSGTALTLNGNGNATSAQNTFNAGLTAYNNWLTGQMQKLLLAGKNPADVALNKDLRKILGESNVSKPGKFTDEVTIDKSDPDNLSDGNPNDQKNFGPGEDGKSYPGAYLDFKDLKDLSALVGSGFDSNCKTCTNHYSIEFEDDIINNNNEQIPYSVTKSGNNYNLKINISYLEQKGVTPQNLAKAIVKIVSVAEIPNGRPGEEFDFHYTQYAAQGTRLYLYDNRLSTSRDQSNFSTSSYAAKSYDTFEIAASSSPNGKGSAVGISYTYDYADFADRVKMTMEEDSNGGYVKDGSKYREYNNVTDSGKQRYQIKTEYLASDLKTVVTLGEAMTDYANGALQSMLNATSVTLNTNDYTFITMGGEENPNVAVRAVFESYVKEVPTLSGGINIKHSGMDFDMTIIPRFAMNTVAMGIANAGTKTIQQASRTIDNTKKALEYVSKKRATYGAIQNRLEHTYNNNLNKAENTTAAESRIRDTDIGEAILAFSVDNILMQAGTAMLSQANQWPSTAIQLLQ